MAIQKEFRWITLLIAVSCFFTATWQECRAQIELLGSCETPNSGLFVEVQGDYAYVMGLGDLLGIVDVSEPTNPHVVATYDTVDTPWGTDVYAGYVFSANSYRGLFIIDVSNPVAPVFTGHFFGSDVHHAVVAQKNIAYLQTCRRFYTIDISNPSNPIEISNISTAPPDARGLFIDGNYAYIVKLEFGLQIIDVTDPGNLELRGSYSDLRFSGVLHVDLVAMNGFAYIPTYDGLQIVNVVDPDSPSLAGTYDSTFIGERICYGDDHLYLTGEDRGLRVLNVSNPVSPYLVIHYDLSGYRDISYQDGLIYALAGHRLDIFVFELVDIVNESELPNGISCLWAFLNPFNLSTTISYSVSEQSYITLSIYNLLGQRVATVFDGLQDGGEHSLTWDASAFPSGVYFARLEVGGRSETVKMVLLK